MAPGEVVLGVDLGASNSVVAVASEAAGVEVIANDIGAPTTPSCVKVDDRNGERLVGEAALRVAVGSPASTVRNVKRVLGLSLDAIEVESPKPLGCVRVAGSSGGRAAVIQLGADGDADFIEPEQIASLILIELKRAAEAHLQRAVGKAVIAVPAYFSAAQRRAVVDAASLAGLEVQQLVTETTAAALAYAHCRGGGAEAKTVLLLDVGGGGGSVAVARVECCAVSVLAASGRRLPGGEDFDARMVDYIKQGIEAELQVAVADPRALELLRAQWERAKRKLQSLPAARLAAFLPGVDLDLQRDVRRAELDEQCDDLFRRVADELLPTLRKAQVEPEQLDDVVLVGGSTRIPRLRQLVQEALGGRPLCKALNPDEAVAVGAALLAAGTATLSREVTPLQLDVLYRGNAASVTPNTKLPVVVGRIIVSSAEGGEEDEDLKGTLMVRQGFLDGPGSDAALATIFEAGARSPLPAGTRGFALDASGLFHFLDAEGAELDACLGGCLRDDQLQLLRERTGRILREDQATLERMEARNKLEERSRALLAWANELQLEGAAGDAVRRLQEGCAEALDWLRASADTASAADCEERLQVLATLEVDLEEERTRLAAAAAANAAARDKLKQTCITHLQLEQKVADGSPEDKCLQKLNSLCFDTLALLEGSVRLATAAECEERQRELDRLRMELDEALSVQRAAAAAAAHASATSRTPTYAAATSGAPAYGAATSSTTSTYAAATASSSSHVTARWEDAESGAGPQRRKKKRGWFVGGLIELYEGLKKM